METIENNIRLKDEVKVQCIVNEFRKKGNS